MPKIKFLKLKPSQKFPAIMNERPKGMSYEHYRDAMRSQSKRLKARLRSGFKLS